MKYLLILATMLLVFSCNTQKRCQKHINKAKILGCLSETDSIKTIIKFVKGDSIHDTTKLVVEKRIIDSLYLQDTCYTIERVDKVLKNAKIKPICVDNVTHKLSIKVDGGTIIYDLIIKDRFDTTQVRKRTYIEEPPSKCGFKIPNNLLFLIGLIIILAFLFKFLNPFK